MIDAQLLHLSSMLIENAEGFSAEVYLCPANKKSIGYGRNLEVKPLSDDESKLYLKNGILIIDEAIAHRWVENDVKVIYDQINKELWFIKMDVNRKAVIIDFIYNVGIGTFKKYKNMIIALENEDYEKAAYEMEHGTGKGGKSKYYLQTKSRAIRNIEILRSGRI